LIGDDFDNTAFDTHVCSSPLAVIGGIGRLGSLGRQGRMNLRQKAEAF
jgi:hypothetical protein